MQIGIGILLEEDAYNYARDLELKISNQFNTKDGLRQPPHVTIKPPFEVSSLEPFISYFDTLVKSIKPFELELGGIDSFAPSVIYIKVTENPDLENLHLKILDELEEQFDIKPNQFEAKGYAFHSTLAMGDLSQDKYAKAMEYLQKENKSFKFKFTTIGLFYLFEEKDWIVIRVGKVKG
ncbi:MAG: 2'-5' RNA ligase family protein [Candidatus Curtissbacteria bacterium]|nr:2'-5' RNA ligase family protein [Candidatus Curtissbacteria bacterium]